MKNNLKRSDTILANNLQEVNLQKDMQQLLQIRNFLNSKLTPLTKTIQKDISNFVLKHFPHETGKFSLIDMECNLFGTNRTFLEFSNNYKTLFNSFQADIKSVAERLQNFSVTRNLSVFITEGIVDNFIKLNKLMFYRQQHCQKLMKQLQQNILNNKPLHFFINQQNQLCSKCQSHRQRENIINTKQMMLFGGQKIYNYYKKSIEPKLVTESDQDEQAQNYISLFYDRIMKIKRNVKQQILNVDNEDLMTQQEMKFTLDKLQSNLQQRKYDILACLIQMGQFGTEITKSFTNIEKHSQPINKPQQHPLPQITKILPKFNYNQFTFNIGKHFHKQIKEIQTQISKIKHQYRDLLATQMNKFVTKQTQCNLIKDVYEQEIDKHKKKTERQINLLHGRISQLQQNNKLLKNKLEESSHLTRKNLTSKMDLDKAELEKKTIEKTTQKLVEKYEAKIKEQQNEMKKLKVKANSVNNKVSQTIEESQRQKQEPSLSIHTNKSCLITSTKIEEKQNKVNYEALGRCDKNEVENKPEKKKKISMFLQPIMKKLYERQSNSTFVQHSCNALAERNIHVQSNHNRVSIELPQGVANSCVTLDKGLTQLAIENYINSTCQMIQSLQVNEQGEAFPVSNIPKSHNKFTLIPQLFSVIIHPHQSPFNSNRQTLCYDHLKPINLRKSLQQLKHKQMIKNVANHDKLPSLKSQHTSKHKLLKAKSYQNYNLIKTHSSQLQDQIINRHPKPLNNAQLKRYFSEHSNHLKNNHKPSTIINKTLKQKTNRKVFKTLSLTTLKKQDNQNPPNSPKLPSLSQHEKPHLINKSTQKIKNFEKLQKLVSQNKNGTLLTKKKRKKRNFSQQQIGFDSYFQNNLTISLGGNDIKGKKKKQYIIDFIPKVEEETISKCKEEYQKVLQNYVSGLFSVESELSMRGSSQNSKEHKNQKNSKTIIIVNKSPSKHLPHLTKRLSNTEISLSTKIYSAMASIKSQNLCLYLLIRQKLQQDYKRDENTQTNAMLIKTICDETENKNKIISNQEGTQETANHMPLSMQKENGLKDSSFDVKKKSQFHTLSTKTNQMDEESDIPKDKYKQDKENEEKQLRKIINNIIARHRNHSCQDQVQLEQKEQNRYIEGHQNRQNQQLKLKGCCKHLSKFYQFLKECKTNK